MKIKLSTIVESVNHEKETLKAENTTAKNEVAPDVSVEAEATQVYTDIPAAVPTTQRKPIDDNRGDLFLPDISQESDKTPPIPKAASTDRPETERKPLPSPLQLDSACKWLRSFNMEERIRGRCEPVSRCRFLMDWLSDELRKEFSERGNLRWRDWNFIFDDLQRFIPPEGEVA